MLNVTTGQTTEVIGTSYQNIDTRLLKLKKLSPFQILNLNRNHFIQNVQGFQISMRLKDVFETLFII